MIPTRSQMPTKYLPRFAPLCSPDNPLKAMTSALNFHLSSSTSIQCAVTPKNDALVVSADQQSAVVEIRPGAFYSGKFQRHMMFDCILLTKILSFRFFRCAENLLWMYTFTSCMLGRSLSVDLGHIATRQFRNAVLLANAKD